MSGSAFYLAIATLVFALYMLWLSNRSERGAMGRSGPGIRTAETTKCAHTWAAAQQVAVPIYRLIAMYLSATAAAVLALGFVNGTIAVVFGLVVAIGVQIFFLGVATVFNWPGMGLLFIQAVGFADIPVMAAYLCLIALIFVVINLFVDLLYFAVDPRLRIEKSAAGH